MNKDQINLSKAYSRIYLKEDENFQDQIDPSVQERAESVYEEEIPPVEGENEDDLNEKKEKFAINTPTQAELIAKTRAPIHKPTMQIKPKKGIYNRQQFKKDYE